VQNSFQGFHNLTVMRLKNRILPANVKKRRITEEGICFCGK